jgi:hypothetical protein
MPTIKRIILLFCLVVTLICLVPSFCYANSAEPPSVLIIVSNAPEDLEISLGDHKAYRTDKAFESYFAFYRSDLKFTGYTLTFTTGDSSFDIALTEPLDSYNNVFTLDLENRTLNPGKSPLRSVALVSLRVVLTLLIEGLIFYLFGFRKKRSWLIFLIINLVTQGVLNIMLNINYHPLTSYVIFNLIVWEFFVFVIELVAFLVLVREHRWWRKALFVIVVNLLSLIAGGFLISVLPV